MNKKRILRACMAVMGVLLPLKGLDAATVGALDGSSNDSTFENVPLNTSMNLPNAAFNWVEISGVGARALRGPSGNAVLLAEAGDDNAPYGVEIDTGVNIEAWKDYTLTVDIGFYKENLAGSDRVAHYDIQLGTISGGTFFPLRNLGGTVVWSQHFGDGPSDTAVLTYSSGGQVTGHDLAVRLYFTATVTVAKWVGFDNVVLESENSATTPVGVLNGANTNSTLESISAGSYNLPNATYSNWGCVYGAARLFRDASYPNAAIIGQNATAAYTIHYNTGIAIEPWKDYTLSVDMGFMTSDYGTGRLADYIVKIGTVTGGSFLPLATTSGTVKWVGTLGDEPSGSATVRYNSGGTVNGDNLAVRLYYTGGDYYPRWFGFDNIILTKSSAGITTVADLDQAIASNSTFQNISSGSYNLPNSTYTDWNTVYGSARLFKDSSTSYPNAALIGQNATAAYTIHYNTGVAYEANTDYVATVDMGFMTSDYGTGRKADYILKIGTVSGGSFVELGRTDGTVKYVQNFGVGPSAVGRVYYSTGSSVSGNIALRFYYTGGPYYPRWFGFDNVMLAKLDSRNLKVMQYNVHHGRGTDGVVNLQRIADVIELSGAEIVGLNEVDNGYHTSENQARWLAQRLGMYYYFGPAHSSLLGNAILSKYPFTATANHLLTTTSGFEQRACAEAWVDVARWELPFLVTHLCHNDATQRETESYDVRDDVASNIARYKMFVGDINSWKHDDYDLANVIIEQHFLDALELVGNPWAMYDYIDYVYLSTDLPNAVFSASRIFNAATVLASDHRPVLVDMNLGQE